MNKNTFILILASILLANFLFGYLLSNEFVYNKAITISISKLIYILVIVYFCRKYKLLNLKLFRFDLFLLLSIVIAFLSYLQMDSILAENTSVRNHKSHFEFIIRCVSTGFFEEILFRIFVFYSLLKLYNYKKLIHLVWVSSIIFGLAHASNVFSPNLISLSVLTQIVFAIFIGVFFQSVFIRTKSYFLVAILHAVTNYFGSYRSYLFLANNENEPYLMSDLFTTILVFGLSFLLIFYPLSLVLIRQESKKFETENA